MCEQTMYGFNCVCDHMEKNPGHNEYCCEFCGIYNASKPCCNKCECVTETVWPDGRTTMPWPGDEEEREDEEELVWYDEFIPPSMQIALI